MNIFHVRGQKRKGPTSILSSSEDVDMIFFFFFCSLCLEDRVQPAVSEDRTRDLYRAKH